MRILWGVILCWIVMAQPGQCQWPPDAIARAAETVRAATKNSVRLPEPTPGKVLDLSKFDIARQIAETGYRVTDIEDFVMMRNFVSRRIVLDPAEDDDTHRIAIALAAGHNCLELDYMLGAMVMWGSAPITPSSFEQLIDGPGDVCIISKRRDKQQKIIRTLQFSRGSVWVYVHCSRDVDLLPAARVVDEALKECVTVDTDALKKLLPDVAIGEPARIGEPDERTYRVDFSLSSPLEKHQKIVAVSPATRAQFRVEKDHVVITLTEGELPEFSVGVYDAKKVWVKWQDEGGSPKKEDENLEKHGEE